MEYESPMRMQFKVAGKTFLFGSTCQFGNYGEVVHSKGPNSLPPMHVEMPIT